jgi:hypothetical protein
MAVFIYTSDAQKAYDQFKAAISAGHIKLWKIDSEGDLVHTAADWSTKVYLKPLKFNNYLRLNVIYFKGVQGTREMYGVICGRVMEMFIAHVSAYIDSVGATKNASDGDATFTG